MIVYELLRSGAILCIALSEKGRRVAAFEIHLDHCSNPRRFLKNTGGSYCLFIQLFEFAQGLVAIADHLVEAILHRDLAGKNVFPHLVFDFADDVEIAKADAHGVGGRCLV